MTLQEEAIRLQTEMKQATQHMRDLNRQRQEVFLALHRQGMTPRAIAKLVGVNHSIIYKVLERAGYEPEYSFKAAHLRKQTQRMIVEKARIKMAKR